MRALDIFENTLLNLITISHSRKKGMLTQKSLKAAAKTSFEKSYLAQADPDERWQQSALAFYAYLPGLILNDKNRVRYLNEITKESG